MTKKAKPITEPSTELDDFVADLLQFIEGGGSMTGLWGPFYDWCVELGYTPREIILHCDAIRERAGRD